MYTFTMLLNNQLTDITVEGPSGPVYPEDDYREVTFLGMDGVRYRGVFFHEMNPVVSAVPCRYEDNQMLFVKSLDEAMIRESLEYIVSNRLEEETLERMDGIVAAQLETTQLEPPDFNLCQVDARANGWIRSAIVLLRAANIARSRDDIVNELIKRGRQICELVERDENNAMKGE